MPESVLDGLRERTVLVTGAGSGLGLSVATRFLDHGATVGGVILPGDERGLANLAPLQERGLTLIEADVSDAATIIPAIEGFIATVGTVDVLVSNAGIGMKAPFLETTDDDWEKIFRVHVGGAVNTTRACLPGMIEQGFGRVLYTASELVTLGLPGLTHYCAAKGALASMARALAREVGPQGVTVNCVAPGPTLTPMFMAAPDEYNDENRMTIPMRTFGDPDTVAWTWLFLASDAGAWTTGQLVGVNGGVAM
jgi:3-oxoacyl-[acyl-carrier protein] reductase